MQGARGRKRRGAHQETLQTQHYLLRSRCPTRRSSTPQLLPLRNIPPGTPFLQPPLRILTEESRAATMQNDTVTLYEINVKEEVTPYDGSLSTSAPLTQQNMDQDGPCALLSSAVESPQQDVDDQTSVVPHDEHIIEKCKTHDGPSRTRCLSPSHSLNLTEFARALQDHDSDDPDEVESTPYERVHGHKVKIEIASLVGAIFDKYGDITAESDVKSPSIIASLILERLCKVYQRLEQGNFFDIKRGEINDMLDELRFYENQKLNVGWLLDKVEEICGAKKSTEEYLLIKGEAAKCLKVNESIEEEIQHNQRHTALIQKKISAAEKQKEANVAKADEYTKMALDIKARVKALATKSLVHGLL